MDNGANKVKFLSFIQNKNTEEKKQHVNGGGFFLVLGGRMEERERRLEDLFVDNVQLLVKGMLGLPRC
jgi:hypothetical protein